MPPHVTLKLTINEAEALKIFLDQGSVYATAIGDEEDDALDRIEAKLQRVMNQKASQ